MTENQQIWAWIEGSIAAKGGCLLAKPSEASSLCSYLHSFPSCVLPLSLHLGLTHAWRACIELLSLALFSTTSSVAAWPRWSQQAWIKGCYWSQKVAIRSWLAKLWVTRGVTPDLFPCPPVLAGGLWGHRKQTQWRAPIRNSLWPSLARGSHDGQMLLQFPGDLGGGQKYLRSYGHNFVGTCADRCMQIHAEHAEMRVSLLQGTKRHAKGLHVVPASSKWPASRAVSVSLALLLEDLKEPSWIAWLMNNWIRLPPCHSVDLTNQSVSGLISMGRRERTRFENSLERDGSADQTAVSIPISHSARASLSLLHAWWHPLAAMISLWPWDSFWNGGPLLALWASDGSVGAVALYF